MPTDDFARASYPLFEEGLVDTLEWSFDMAWRIDRIPGWCTDLLDFFAEQDRLVGHGVSYSVLSSDENPLQTEYLNRLKREVAARKYQRISEHFGVARGGPYSFNTVFPVPFSRSAVLCGVESLQKLHSACAVPIGLENLAFAFGRPDVTEQGTFLRTLLDAVDGYLVLDLHNLWCQMQNYSVSFQDIVSSYPLDRVRELHVSGGSWSNSQQEAGRRIRRDTHDDLIPEALNELVRIASQKCPSLEAVIYERLGNTISGDAEETSFCDDFRRLKTLLECLPDRAPAAPTASRAIGRTDDACIDDCPDELGAYQTLLFTELSRDLSAEQLKSKLLSDAGLRVYQDYLQSFELGMLETAQLLVRKWGESNLAYR